MSNQKQAIILLGPPGSGKGTQGTLLGERLNLYLFETSKILEDYFKTAQEGDFMEVDGQKYFAQDEIKLRAEGKLCSPPFVTQLVKKKMIELANDGHSIVTSGSPRTLYEGEALIPLLKELYGSENVKVIVIKTTVEDSIFRNSHRKICELMRHSILYSEEFEKLNYCPIDGSKLIKREGVGDDPETIKTRFEEYQQRTLPLVEFFKSQGLLVKEIDGKVSPADVFDQILKALE